MVRTAHPTSTKTLNLLALGTDFFSILNRSAPFLLLAVQYLLTEPSTRVPLITDYENENAAPAR